VPAVLRQLPEGGDMGALARRAAELFRSRVGFGGHRRRLALGGETEHVTLEDMRHDEIGRGRDRGVDRPDRIADEALQLLHGAVVERGAVCRRSGQFEIHRIAYHGRLLAPVAARLRTFVSGKAGDARACRPDSPRR